MLNPTHSDDQILKSIAITFACDRRKQPGNESDVNHETKSKCTHEDIVSYDWPKLLNTLKIMRTNKSIPSERGRCVFEPMSSKLYETCDEKHVMKKMYTSDLYLEAPDCIIYALAFWLAR